MTVRTVLGDVGSAGLGPVDYHEHLFQVSPLLPGDELVDEEVSRREAGRLVDSGIATVVDATPVGLGRRPEAVARISAATGLVVVAATGFHRSAHYADETWILDLTVDDLATWMTRDVTTAISGADTSPRGAIAVHAGAPVRAGILKVGIDYWRIDAFARRVVDAIGAAHDVTNAPVMVHLEHGSAAFEVLRALAGVGVVASAVVLAHVDRNPDPGLHAELAATGAYLGYDGPARHREHPDSTLIECISATIALGGGSRIMIGGDVARASRFVEAGGMPGMEYLPRRFVPRLRDAVGEDAIQSILVSNPRTFLDRF